MIYTHILFNFYFLVNPLNFGDKAPVKSFDPLIIEKKPVYMYIY